jgi:hypothetical protein
MNNKMTIYTKRFIDILHRFITEINLKNVK